MYKDKKIISIIPARKNSKGIPGKNWKLLCGKPLISYSIEQSLACEYIDYTVVSSDSKDIEEIVGGLQNITKKLLFVKRPEQLATDTSSTESAMIHVLENVKDIIVPDVVCLLQPTSPIRHKDLIKNCIENYFMVPETDSLMTVTKCEPFFVRFFKDQPMVWYYDPKNRPPRQALRTPDDFFLFDNGNLYLTDTDALMKTKCRIGERTSIFATSEEEGYQIDTPLDFVIIEAILKDLPKDSM